MVQQLTGKQCILSGLESTRIDVATILALAATRQQADQQGVQMSLIMSDTLRETIKSLGIRLS